MKSLAELKALRDKMQNSVNLRENAEGGMRIVVGMATCGIAAGARPVLSAFVDTVAEKKIENVTVFNGFDEMCIGGLAMGADGAIGSTYNFMADKFLKIYDEFHNGSMAKAQEIQNEANVIITEMIKYGVFQSEKAVLTHLGIDMGPCRKPFLPISKEGFDAMKKVAESL